ncbi:MAG: Gfo/Idh/MocA family oxidoreductase [Armatimonadetes bacterium]|nr:Gfo/Idh/MocA family oxidoreductase [Armatimonadota bacterium]
MGISIGLVGLGSFGSAFAPLFKRHPLVDRVALCDAEPERLARFAEDPSFQDKFNPRDAYESFEDLLASDVDAVAIITQPWFHAPQALAALNAGKHVYSAVPIAWSPDGDEILDWCDKLVDACTRTGLYYMLGETTYYRPEAMYCRRKAAEGAFGDFVYAEGEYFHDVDQGLREVRANRLGSKTGQEWAKRAQEYLRRGIKTGPMHYPTHSASGPVCVMKTRAVKVLAYGFENMSGEPWFDDYAFSNETALFLMSNGATVRLCEFREVGLPGRETFRIYGTEGSFSSNTWFTDHSSTPLTVEEMRDPLPPEVLEAYSDGADQAGVYGGHGGSHAYLVHEFVSAVAEDHLPAINIWEAVKYMAMGVMAHKSALAEGEILEIPDWGDPPRS